MFGFGKKEEEGPPQINEAAVRLKSGLKKGVTWAAIAAGGTVALAGAVALAFPGATILGMTASSLFAPGALTSGAGMALAGITGGAGALGVLYGAMDDKAPTREQALLNKDYASKRMSAVDQARMGAARQQQAAHYNEHRDLMGLGSPGGFRPSPFPGSLPGGGMERAIG